tara:strand:+ start:233 stop:655 length:423 start_codon:yes stop_codon:yes gene_type:complete
MKSLIKKLLREELVNKLIRLEIDEVHKPGEYTHENVKLEDLYVLEKNMNEAWNIKGGSKTKDPLEVFQMLDNSKFLLDGHHRVCDYIIKSGIIDKEEILKLEIYSNILQTPIKNSIEALGAKLFNGYIPFIEWLKKINIY